MRIGRSLLITSAALLTLFGCKAKPNKDVLAAKFLKNQCGLVNPSKKELSLAKKGIKVEPGDYARLTGSFDIDYPKCPAQRTERPAVPGPMARPVREPMTAPMVTPMASPIDAGAPPDKSMDQPKTMRPAPMRRRRRRRNGMRPKPMNGGMRPTPMNGGMRPVIKWGMSGMSK